jgi:hypothetical protein
MKKSLSLLIIGCCAALISGCATGPKYNEVKASIPPLSQESGRIYFYRTAVLGAAVQPAVKLNGQEIGTAKPKGFFYVDRAPGDYQVETSTEVKRRLSLTLDKGQARYVRLDISMGFFVGHVYPELVENEAGEKEISECSYTGTK